MKIETTPVAAVLLMATACAAQIEFAIPHQLAAMTWPEAKSCLKSQGTNSAAFQEQFATAIRRMTEDEFWSMLSAAYSNGWDDFSAGNVFLAPRISDTWEKTPPAPEFFIGIATNRALHIGLRSAMAKAGLGCSSKWKTPQLCEYLDSLWAFLDDESIEARWKLHVCDYLNPAYEWKIGDMAHNNTITYDPSTFDSLHERAPRFFQFLSDTLIDFTNKSDITVISAGDELTALTRTYINRNPQESESAARAVSAAQEARRLLANVLTDTNYHPKARERIRSQDDWIHVVALSTNQNQHTNADEH